MSLQYLGALRTVNELESPYWCVAMVSLLEFHGSVFLFARASDLCSPFSLFLSFFLEENYLFSNLKQCLIFFIYR